MLRSDHSLWTRMCGIGGGPEPRTRKEMFLLFLGPYKYKDYKKAEWEINEFCDVAK